MLDTKSLILLFLSIASVHAQCILTAGDVNLLSAEGLATPWVLSGKCTQLDPNTQSFIEATIYEPAQNMIYAYSPLVIDAGTQPLIPPVVPRISAEAIIVYHFGCNANTLTLMDKNGGRTLAQANCVNGDGNSVFGQFAYCNAVQFFTAAQNLQNGNQIPPLNNALDGTPCPTTRSFEVVDQDQSDNVVTAYILSGNQTAQKTAANMAIVGARAMVISNPSDNALLSLFIDPAIGCTPFRIPSLDDPGIFRSTLASDELMAAAHQAPPIALVPITDPMTLNNGKPDIQKVNKYRLGVNQMPTTQEQAGGAAYCNNLASVGAPTILNQGIFTSKATTPSAAMATTLFTFLGARFNMSWVNLNCFALTGLHSPIIAHIDGQGVAFALTFFINGKVIGPTTVGGPINGPISSVPPVSATLSSQISSLPSVSSFGASNTISFNPLSNSVPLPTSLPPSELLSSISSGLSSSSFLQQSVSLPSGASPSSASSAFTSSSFSQQSAPSTTNLPSHSTSQPLLVLPTGTPSSGSVSTPSLTIISIEGNPPLSSTTISSPSLAIINPGSSTPSASITASTSPSGPNVCNGVPFNSRRQVCVNGQQLCPINVPNLCGQACYSALHHQCCNGQIVGKSRSC